MFSALSLQYSWVPKELSVHRLYCLFIALFKPGFMVIGTNTYLCMYQALLLTPFLWNSVKTPTLCLPWNHTKVAKCGWRNYTMVLTLHIWWQISVSQSYHLVSVFTCFLFKVLFPTSSPFTMPKLLLCVENLTSYFPETKRSNQMRVPSLYVHHEMSWSCMRSLFGLPP